MTRSISPSWQSWETELLPLLVPGPGGREEEPGEGEASPARAQGRAGRPCQLPPPPGATGAAGVEVVEVMEVMEVEKEVSKAPRPNL